MALRFVKIAVVYLFIGALLGLIMGIRQNFSLAPVHAHLALLGRASLALAGVIYHLYPAAATRLAKVHFRIHNLALPVFMVAPGMMLTGTASAGPIVAVSATGVLVGLALFVTDVLLNIRAATANPAWPSRTACSSRTPSRRMRSGSSRGTNPTPASSR
jgi:cbb3-type cytochrome oxidase subunit 1